VRHNQLEAERVYGTKWMSRFVGTYGIGAKRANSSAAASPRGATQGSCSWPRRARRCWGWGWVSGP
jgi:hypothetical protein